MVAGMVKIGDKIRNLRLKNNLTQSELGNRCDLTKGFISQLESDITSPALSTLEDILNCLGTSFNEFFSEVEEEKVVYGSENVIVKEFDDSRVFWLVSDAQKKNMEPVLIELDGESRTEEEYPHEGEEFGYVLQGSVTLYLGEKKYKVKKGESFYFQPKAPHSLKNSGKTGAKVLWVATPPSFSFGG